MLAQPLCPWVVPPRDDAKTAMLMGVVLVARSLRKPTCAQCIACSSPHAGVSPGSKSAGTTWSPQQLSRCTQPKPKPSKWRCAIPFLRSDCSCRRIEPHTVRSVSGQRIRVPWLEHVRRCDTTRLESTSGGKSEHANVSTPELTRGSLSMSQHFGEKAAVGKLCAPQQ